MNEKTEAILSHMIEDAQDIIAFCEKAASFNVTSEYWRAGEPSFDRVQKCIP
ncbi:MAG: hypothetical protein FWC75_01980 [Oscillospiraceae bacterium]|nr:hypothetical protein [Oscillospiraceae bacterium]